MDADKHFLMQMILDQNLNLQEAFRKTGERIGMKPGNLK